jgi:hypothetical protein
MMMMMMYSSANQFRAYALLFLNATLTCDTSQTPVWETWLDQHDLSCFKDMTGAPNSLSVLKRQIDLGRIIEDMLSQTLPPKKMAPGGSKRWAEISLNRLNARLCSWHNALPGDMRWDRWGSSFDVVHPSIASLQYEIRNPHFANTNDTTVCSTTPHGYLLTEPPSIQILQMASANPLRSVTCLQTSSCPYFAASKLNTVSEIARYYSSTPLLGPSTPRS